MLLSIVPLEHLLAGITSRKNPLVTFRTSVGCYLQVCHWDTLSHSRTHPVSSQEPSMELLSLHLSLPGPNITLGGQICWTATAHSILGWACHYFQIHWTLTVLHGTWHQAPIFFWSIQGNISCSCAGDTHKLAEQYHLINTWWHSDKDNSNNRSVEERNMVNGGGKDESEDYKGRMKKGMEITLAVAWGIKPTGASRIPSRTTSASSKRRQCVG